METSTEPRPFDGQRTALQTVAAYGALGVLWLIFSYAILPSLFHSPALIPRLQIASEGFLIALTSVLLYRLVQHRSSERSHSEETLRHIVQGVSASDTDSFFQSFAQHLAQSLGMSHALVAEMEDGSDEQLRTLAVFAKGESIPNFEYRLREIPCKEFPSNGFCHVQDARAQHPREELFAQWEVEGYAGICLVGSTGENLGLLLVMDQKPIKDPSLVESILQVFASRAAAEIERKRGEEVLHLRNRAIKAISEGVLILDARDPGHPILFANAGFEQLTSYAEGDVQGKSYRMLLGPETDPATLEEIESALARQQTTITEALAYPREGQPFWSHFSLSPVRDSAEAVSHFVMVMKNIDLRKRREEELEAIVALTTALRYAQTRSEMLPLIADQVTALLHAQGTAISLYDPFQERTVVEVGRGVWTVATRMKVCRGEGVTGRVIATGKSYLNNQAHQDPNLINKELLNNLQSVACVPLLSVGQTIGALAVARAQPIDEEELRLLETLGDIATNALRRAVLHEQTEQRLQRLAALRRIDRAISASLDLDVTLNVFLDQVTSQLHVDAATILMFHPQTRTFQYAAGRGFRANGIRRSQVRLGEGVDGRAALEGRVAIIPDLREEPETFARSSLLTYEDFVSYYVLPLNAKGQIKGLLEVFHRSPLSPDPEWVEFLEILAGQAAIAIDNAELFDDLQRSNIELTLAYDTTLEGWVKALDMRDREISGHTQRVTDLTLRLAIVMGLDDEEMLNVRRGALLHDIGKMALPDGVLLKPGPLSEDEWKIMKMHPVYAYEMLSAIPYLRPALDIPYCHHEKWDGTGYPRGLKGEQIPLSARMFAVTDVWDALLSDRPYRRGWPEEKVLEHILSLSGTHFDPKIVEAFLLATNKPPSSRKPTS